MTAPLTNVAAVSALVESLDLDELGVALARLALTFAAELDVADDSKTVPSLGRELRLTLLDLAPREVVDDGDPDSWLRDAMPSAVQYPA